MTRNYIDLTNVWGGESSMYSFEDLLDGLRWTVDNSRPVERFMEYYENYLFQPIALEKDNKLHIIWHKADIEMGEQVSWDDLLYTCTIDMENHYVALNENGKVTELDPTDDFYQMVMDEKERWERLH